MWKEIHKTVLYKLIFFAQITSLAITWEKLFNEDFTAYKFWPVVDKLHKKLESENSIIEAKEVYNDDWELEVIQNNFLSQVPPTNLNTPKYIIDVLFKKFKWDLGAWDMADYTHLDSERERNKPKWESNVWSKMDILKSDFLPKAKKFISPEEAEDIEEAKYADNVYKDLVTWNCYVS